MADDVLAEKVFNYICSSGGFVEISVLLKSSSPLGSRKTEIEARNWLKSQTDRRLVVVKDSKGETAGMRIDLRRKLCRQYHSKGSCRSAHGKCKFWHICKGFMEDNCLGECSLSHNFLDEKNYEKTKQLGLDKHPNETIKNIVARSLPQVCERYTKGKCMSDKCLYLHLCSQVVRRSTCNCCLSHDITDSHNKAILKQYDLLPHQSMSTDFVCCSILVPKEQRVIDNIITFSPDDNTRSTSGETTLDEALKITLGTKPSEPPIPSKNKCTKSPSQTTEQSSPSSLSLNGSKEVDIACSLPGKTECRKQNSQRNRLRKKTSKADPPCKQTDRFNNLTGNEASPSSESGLAFLNIETGEESDSSSDENKSGNRIFNAVRCGDDKEMFVESSLQANEENSQRLDSAVDAVKVDTLRKDLRKTHLEKENKLDGNSTKKSEQESKTNDSLKRDPKRDKSKKEGLKDPTISKALNKQQPKRLGVSHDTKGNQSQHESNIPLDSVKKEFVETLLTSRDFASEGSSSCTDSHRLPTSQDLESGRQRKLSVSSSCSSVQESNKCAPSKKAVFDCILKEYNGTVSLDVISKRQDLFPTGCGDIAKWFGARKESFLIREKEGQMFKVNVLCRKARFCFKEKCYQKDCQYVHVCREYVAGVCRRGAGCQRNHSFQYDIDRKFIAKLNLDGMTEEHLRKVFQLSSPQVCLDYNDGCCTKGLYCGQVHICKDFIKKRCEDEEDCGLCHERALDEAHTIAILQRYGLSIRNGNISSVLRTLLVCEHISSGLRDHKRNSSTKNVTNKESREDQHMPSKGGVALVTSEPSEVKVFECLCKEYDCSASFSVISKRTGLFPSEFKDVESWFRRKIGSFLVTEDAHGRISQVHAFSTKARLCLSYNNCGECTRGNCSYLHVCREYVTDSCINGATCPRNHNFQHERDQTLLSKIKLDQLTDEQLRKLVLSSTPQICVEYNNGTCSRGESCLKIHMCRDHLKKCYREGHRCSLLHEAAMNTEHTQKVLKRYQMSHLNCEVVKKIILVCDQHKESTCTKEKHQGHIRSENPDASICPEFLVGKCKNGFKCTNHHCFLPYHWQWHYADGSEWKSFNDEDNEKLETLYCDVRLEECSATSLQISFESDGVLLLDERCDVNILLDNKLLIIQKDFEALARIRRLSTDSNVIDPGPLATKWVWYWQHENGLWRPYHQDSMGKDLQVPLEKAFLNKKNDFKFRIAGQDYLLSFTPSSDMSQTNINYGTTKKVRRRPAKVVSKDDISQTKRCLDALPANKQQGRNSRGYNIPSHWSSMPPTRQYQRVQLPPSSDEFKEVEKHFRKSIKRSVVIISIERVQNPFMWEKYQRKKENMASEKTVGSNRRRAVNEKQLFHGTSPEIVEAICKQNFDWRLHGKNATVYGKGCYFALNSSYSDSYANEDSSGSKFMFVAKVLAGSYTTGDRSYPRPPPKNPSNPLSDLYDSCVDDVSFPTIFVVFDTDQFYPEYIIEYSAATSGYQQSAWQAPIPRPRRPQATVTAATAAAAASPRASNYSYSYPSTSYQTPTSSTAPVQAAYSGVHGGTGVYTSTSSAAYSTSSSAYGYTSTARATPYTGVSSRYPSTVSASSRYTPSPPSTRPSSPVYQPNLHRSSSRDTKCLVM